MSGVEPAVVGMAERFESADVDHCVATLKIALERNGAPAGPFKYQPCDRSSLNAQRRIMTLMKAVTSLVGQQREDPYRAKI